MNRPCPATPHGGLPALPSRGFAPAALACALATLAACSSGESTRPDSPRPATPAPPAAGSAPSPAAAEPTAGTAASQTAIHFVDATVESGLASFRHRMGTPEKAHLPESVGGGVAFIDHDGDGDLDVYLTNGAAFAPFPDGAVPSDALYENDGTGRYRDVTEAAGLGDTNWTFGVSASDYDGDGWTDLYLTNFGANVLYRNRGDGTFADVTAEAGVGDSSWSTGSSFFDYDRDGDLDLYVANYVAFDKDYVPSNKAAGEYRGIRVAYGPMGLEAAPDTLYRNDGDGTFTNVTAQTAMGDPPHFGFQPIAFDANDDGLVDLFVANDASVNYLYLNGPGGALKESGLLSGAGLASAGTPQAGMGVAAGDFNGDGRIDLYLSHFSEDYNTLYRNDGGGFFTDVSFAMGIAHATFDDLGWGCALFDAENDGDLDIFVANGHVYPQVDEFDFGTSYRQTNQIFENLDRKRLREVTAAAGSGFAPILSSRGAAFGDHDNDGDLDILVLNLDDPPTLLRNESRDQGHWLQLRLVGTQSNRDAVGARVEVTAGGRRHVAHVVSGTSFLSSNDPRLHLGLGTAASVERVFIRWPSGTEQVLEGLAVDQRHRIVEPSGEEGASP